MENTEIVQNQLEWLGKLQNELKQKTASMVTLQRSLHQQLSLPKDHRDSVQHNLSYFRIDDKLPLFVTNLVLAEQDYDRVELIAKWVYLKATIIMIVNGQNIPNKELPISSITKVTYQTTKKIILKFQPQSEQSQTLILTFDDEETMRKWDLGIYINFKIIQSRNKLYLFESQFPQFFEKDDPIQQSQDLRYKPQNEQVVHQMLQNEVEIQQIAKEKSLKQGSDKIQVKPRVSPEPKIQQERPKMRADTEAHIKKQNNSQKRPTDLFRSFQSSKQSNKQTTNNEQLEKVKQKLKNGYLLIKYAEGGFMPHNKKILLSANEKQLWSQAVEDQNSIKKYRVADITNVSYSKIGPGIRKHVQKIDGKHFGVVETSEKDIELGCENAKRLEEFFNNLKLFVSQRRKE